MKNHAAPAKWQSYQQGDIILMNYQNILSDDYILKPDRIYIVVMLLDKLVVSFKGKLSSFADDNGMMSIGINPIDGTKKITIRDNLFRPDEERRWYIIDPDYRGDKLGLDFLDFSKM